MPWHSVVDHASAVDKERKIPQNKRRLILPTVQENGSQCNVQTRDISSDKILNSKGIKQREKINLSLSSGYKTLDLLIIFNNSHNLYWDIGRKGHVRITEIPA